MKPSELATKISTLRHQKGMTQKELAELCNVDIRTIQRIESGEVVPRKHTLKILTNILEYDLIHFDVAPGNTLEDGSTMDFSRQIRRAYIAGVIFSINAIPVVYELITGGLNEFANVITILIHCGSWILLFRGFSLLGKQSNNQVMELSFAAAMILLPLINVMELLKPYYFNLQATGLVFTLLCISGIFCGLSFWLQTYKTRATSIPNVYKVAGTILIMQNAMFLSSNFNIVSGGLVLSLGCNFLQVMIVYAESSGLQRTILRRTSEALV